jgi:hypothetical protein
MPPKSREITCPACFAPPGASCLDYDGRPRTTHAERVSLALSER